MTKTYRKIVKYNTTKYVSLPPECIFKVGDWVKVEEIEEGKILIQKAEV